MSKIQVHPAVQAATVLLLVLALAGLLASTGTAP